MQTGVVMARKNFIEEIIDSDLSKGRYKKIITRFPPEPNGQLHIGHAKSICLNFGLAREYQGQCHLRFDDTNPETENADFVKAIKEDVQWLGFDWGEHCYYASDYFDKLFELALGLVRKGLAYVCDLSEAEMSEYRGTLTTPGKPSPFRNRSIEENEELLLKMKAGDFAEGHCVLRAKIDMSHPNMKMRDPLIYRIRHHHHYRTGDAWCIYPMYDFAHCLSDAIENITHSICTLEFENNRDVYDWFVTNTDVTSTPHQYEFARLEMTYTVLSKRKLLELVEKDIVDGWDDPRMPTLSGMRRRGIPPKAIREFTERIGLAKANSVVEVELLEHCIREAFNFEAPRVMAVLDPIKVTITNFDDTTVRTITAPLYPHDVPKDGEYTVAFGPQIFIERDDFREQAPVGYHRLAIGQEVRLRHAYTLNCTDVIKNGDEIVELLCTIDPDTLGKAPIGRKVKGVIHWVSACEAQTISAHLIDRLFAAAQPGMGKDSFLDDINKHSRVERNACVIGKDALNLARSGVVQFERQGYFVQDTLCPGRFLQVVALKDAWAKQEKREEICDRKPAKERELARAQVEEKVIDVNIPKGFEDVFETLVTLAIDDTEQRALSLAPVEVLHLLRDTWSKVDDKRLAFLWVINEVLREVKQGGTLDLSAERFSTLIKLLSSEAISAATAKEVLTLMLRDGVEPSAYVQKHNLGQISDRDEIATIVDDVLKREPNKLASYLGGQEKLYGFFVGQAMKQGQGRLLASVLHEVLKERLGK